MKKSMLFMLMTSFVYFSCEDDDAGASCQDLMTEMAAEPFVEQLGSLFTLTELPSDWKTNCEAYQAKMQELFDAGCYAPEDSVTQTSIDEVSELCDMEM
tara:strand:- start:407 stop:703 length:297 start_codon:yes stop_codon:yes gene_type:complete